MFSEITQPINVNSTHLTVQVNDVPIDNGIVVYIYKKGILFQYFNAGSTSSSFSLSIPISIQPEDSFYVKIYDRFLRVFSEPSNIAYVVDITTYAYMEEMLNRIVNKNDSYIDTWIDAIIDKTLGGELLPSFISWKNSDGEINSDFISIWKSIIEYFSYYVTASKNITLTSSKGFIQDYLIQKGLFLTGNESIEELNVLKIGFYKSKGDVITFIDADEDIPLHRQCARLHADKQDCDKCINLAEIHWTEIIVCCHKCDKESMMFTEYTVGKNILLFYEECVDLAKPSYPPIEWIEKNGDKIFVISGTGEGFSST